MPNSPPEKPVYRFAPSPNGFLHLGHALSAFLNHDMAKASGGRFLLRIEDIDLTRCTAEFEEMIYRDLTWLGLDWEMPVRRQSEHFDVYRDALDRLRSMGLVYPTFLTRGDVKAHVTAYETDGKNWPRDPDGSPLYPDDDRLRNEAERAHLIAKGIKHAWRMDVMKAMALVGKQLSWQETGTGHPETIPADPTIWGDVILSRSDAPSSYHLSVAIDDALQGITHVVRGADLYTATAIHRLLQELLCLPEPVYHHHQLIVGSDGRKLSKSEGSTGIAALRDEGLLPGDIRRIVGL
ncbi:tRNA glutamyl-Q(34) synthetase GluQRS [Agrobacterium sp. Ap1]|uniref:tRNA glutamyl-Q(34) synthetase GluQRS n=1 Tax=Agrobacterium sp. Ap1 TaxID=2815337 RepID=UPI001A8EECCD|nr:tRNA glutamyl-Q(34) synthetase GluQRS [Agrobacterium sp. Ap1]MBO0143884.1 tRNA glutamyl-Q(34) synthetase GluQRS [Agrobacterium sp. Ap1]